MLYCFQMTDGRCAEIMAEKSFWFRAAPLVLGDDSIAGDAFSAVAGSYFEKL